MLKLIISGVNGRLGQTLISSVQEIQDMEIVAGVDIMPAAIQNPFPVYTQINDIAEQADVVIDFSRPEALPSILDYVRQHKMGAVLCTTGYTDTDKQMIADAAKDVPLFFSANMSLGVNLQIALAQKAAEILRDDFEIEIIEKHHNKKVDSPSGTALVIAETINKEVFADSKELVFGRHSKNDKRSKDEIGIHAVRGGTVVGEHDILFLGPDEIIEINHRALSKQVFAQGALRAARFIHGNPPSLYSMSDIMSEVFNKEV